MKNKKILNICLLTVALITLFTFVLPIKKFEFVGDEVGFITVKKKNLKKFLFVNINELILKYTLKTNEQETSK